MISQWSGNLEAFLTVNWPLRAKGLEHQSWVTRADPVLKIQSTIGSVRDKVLLLRFTEQGIQFGPRPQKQSTFLITVSKWDGGRITNRRRPSSNNFPQAKETKELPLVDASVSITNLNGKVLAMTKKLPSPGTEILLSHMPFRKREMSLQERGTMLFNHLPVLVKSNSPGNWRNRVNHATQEIRVCSGCLSVIGRPTRSVDVRARGNTHLQIKSYNEVIEVAGQQIKLDVNKGSLHTSSPGMGHCYIVNTGAATRRRPESSAWTNVKRLESGREKQSMVLKQFPQHRCGH